MRDDAGFLAILVVVVAGIWFAIWGKDSTIRYALQYDVDHELVTIDRKPTDCDFSRAPLGQKDCHYEKVVAVAMHHIDRSTFRPIVSYDDGKTWYPNEGGPETGTSVRVSWTKKTP